MQVPGWVGSRTVPTTALVTGGAGFIGCALAGRLLGRFDRVVAVDSLHPQVHPTTTRPAALAEGVELVVADVTLPATWDALLPDVRPDAVVHLAAETGTAQSLTEASRHAVANVVGTTAMLDAFGRHDRRPDRVVLASSRAVYGEGAWQDPDGQVVLPGPALARDARGGGVGLPRAQPDARRGGPGGAAPEQRVRGDQACAGACASRLVPRRRGAAGGAAAAERLRRRTVAEQPVHGDPAPVRPARGRRGVIPVYEDGRIVRDFVHVDDVARALESAVCDLDADRRWLWTWGRASR